LDASSATAESGVEESKIGQPPLLFEEAPKTENEARRALSLLTQVLDQLPVALTVQSDDGATLLANERAKALPHRSATAGSEAATTTLAADPAGDGVSITEDRVAGPDGDRTLLTYRKAAHILGRSLSLSATIDFTERKVIETELSKRAYLDHLTGLPNRTLIHEHVEQLLTHGGKPTRFALAFLDIDNFKHINDYYTHAIGDALLVKVAQRITANVRPSDILSRISGDEFLLVLSPLDDDSELATVIENLLQELKEPFLIEGFEILTSASIGVSVYPDHGLNYEMLRRAADTAMYRIKTGAKGGAALFDTDMGRTMAARMAQEQRLRLAVRDGRFCCAFQPKVDIRTQEIVGVEALIRLRDSEGVIQAPGEFIALAVELGLIEDLTYLALGEIVRSMVLIDEAFGPQVTVSINVAAKQAGDLNFMRGFCDELTSTKVPDRFIVEVTEDAFIAKSQFQTHVIPMLQEVGAKVSIDDFGTGYSSLSYLKRFPIDTLKVDRSFIRDIPSDAGDKKITRAIIGMAHSFKLLVVAEGVETADQLAFLRLQRCDIAQGYFLFRPLPEEQVAGVIELNQLDHGGRVAAHG
jgi:diguanylate cyclase (GGDEF)-like protein